MICKKCNSEISDDIRFCPYCGEKVFEMVGETEVLSENIIEPETPEVSSIEVEEQYVADISNLEYSENSNDNQTTVLTVEESSEEIAQGTSVLVADSPIIENTVSENSGTDAYIPKIDIGDLVQKIDENQKPKKAKSLKKILIPVITIFLCITVGSLGFMFFSNNKDDTIETPAVYITDDNELYVIETLGKKEAKTFFVTDDYCIHESYYFSKDGKYILYCTGEEDSMKLEIREIGNDKASPMVLAKNISSVEAVSEDLKTIVYEKNDNVYLVNQKGESETLIKDVFVDNVSPKADSLICCKYDSETDENTLYYVDVKTKNAVELYSDDISYYCDDNNEFVYVLDDTSLYKVDKNAEKEKIAKEVCDFELVGTTLYYTTLAETYTYDKFVNDPYKGKDANVVEPDWDNYEPDRDNYKKEEEGFFGTYTTIDYDAYDKAYAAAEDRYEADYENYVASRERNEVRSILKDCEVSVYNLFSYDSSKSELIYSGLCSQYINNIYNVDGGISSGVEGRIFETPITEIKKVDIDVFISESGYALDDDYYELVFDDIDTKTIIINGKNSIVVDVGKKETIEDIWYDKNMSSYIVGVLVEKDDENIDEICTLYSISEKATSFESAEIIAEDVFAVMHHENDYFTFTDFSKKNSTLTMNTSEGSIDDVDSFGVMFFSSEKGVFYYSTDESDNGEATIWKYSKGESTQIAEDILFSSFCEYDGKYLGLTDVEYSEDLYSGDLICINGDEIYTIESNVFLVEAGNPEWDSPMLISPHYYASYDEDYDEYY